MKNIIDICKDFGIEIPADKHAEFNKAVAENYKTVAEHEKKVNRLIDDLADEKKRADDAVETLKGFEGKDFDAITRERDKWQKDYEQLLEKNLKESEEREYNADLEAAATAAKCRDLKALTAHLDHEALRKSRNRKADMEAAIKDQRTKRSYLFEDNGGNPHFTDPKGNGGNGGNNGTNPKEIQKIRDYAERQKAWAQYLTNHKGE